ncbi:MAG TPA: DUF1704 domain-containing protein, partial [Paracoccaceae bacterium]|nr:DUF1704 domain-containing protein [Paracoccaceae bacterium]
GLLDPYRLRIVAARVLAADRMHHGAPFGDTARWLRREHELSASDAIGVAERAYRGGGVARDVGYLVGWLRVRGALERGETNVDDLRAGLATSFGQFPGTDSQGAELFQQMASAAGFDGTSAFAPESYDAAALIMLAMAKSGSTDSKVWATAVFDVANAPGEPIQPGELGKALELIAAGQDIDYVGASAVELIGPGESAGNYREVEFKDGKIVTVKFR